MRVTPRRRPPLNITLAANLPASDAIPREPFRAQRGFARHRVTGGIRAGNLPYTVFHKVKYHPDN
jgi:hypothetical protein